MYNNKNIIAIIPARGGSKGIRNKNIIDFCNKPLIAWTIEQAKMSKYLDGVFVSSDSENIISIAQKYGSRTITRPSEISCDDSRTEDALIHALDQINNEFDKNETILLVLQTTSPLREHDDIDIAIELYFSKEFDSLFSATRIEDLTIWENNNGHWDSVNFNYKNKLRRQDRPAQYIENGAIYITVPSIIKNNNNIIGGKIGVYQMEFWQSWEIDTIEEVDLVRFFFEKHIIEKIEVNIDLEDIDLIVFDFDGVMTDNRAILLEDGTEGVIINRGDGVGINNLKKFNIPIMILTSESNNVVKKRAEKLNLKIISNIENKKTSLENYLNTISINHEKVMFVGNDLNDSEVMKWVGLPVCPADAHPAIKQISKIVLPEKGGEAISRKIYDLLLKSKKPYG